MLASLTVYYLKGKPPMLTIQPVRLPLQQPVQHRAPRFGGVVADTVAKVKTMADFAALPPLERFIVTLSMTSKSKADFLRKAVLEACNDAMTLENPFNVVPYFVQSLQNKGLVGLSNLIDRVKDAGNELDTAKLATYIREVQAERKANETDPAIRAVLN